MTNRYGYVDYPNELSQRRARTLRMDPEVFEATGQYVPPEPETDKGGVLGTGYTATEVGLAVSVLVLIYEVFL